MLARACNAHTRIFFRDYVWSTVASNLSFYVAVNLAVVGSQFVALRSHEEEPIACVVGEVCMLVDGDVQQVDDKGSQSSLDMDSCMGDEHMLQESDAESELLCDKLQLDCEVHVHHLPLYVAFPMLSWQVSMLVEKLSLSALFPGRVFHSERMPKSMLFPGHVFKGKPQPNWTACTVPVERASVSSKLPGKVFSSHEKQKDCMSVSRNLPSRVFSSQGKPQWKWTSCTIPTENIPLSVR